MNASGQSASKTCGQAGCSFPVTDLKEGLCILHSKDAKKERSHFDGLVAQKLATNDFDFRGTWLTSAAESSTMPTSERPFLRGVQTSAPRGSRVIVLSLMLTFIDAPILRTLCSRTSRTLIDVNSTESVIASALKILNFSVLFSSRGHHSTGLIFRMQHFPTGRISYPPISC